MNVSEVFSPIRFAKMHGLGNDFVVMETLRQSLPAAALTPAVLQQWANRHTGIGFDQLLILDESNLAGVDYRYRIFNADGSEVGQCGNGVRCAHYFLRQQGLTDSTTLVFETITTRMATTQIDECRFRATLPPPQFLNDFEEEGIVFHTLNIGNPHAVCFAKNMSDETLNRIGENLNRRLPDGINVSCATVQNDGIDLRVYERGVGMTQSCGSGCTAAAIAAIRHGHVDSSPAGVTVRMAGGAVVCGMTEEAGVWLEGDVAYVFSGEISL